MVNFILLFKSYVQCVYVLNKCFLFPRILFKDKDRNWDEIENKLRSESEIPLLKTSNKVEGLSLLSVWLCLHLVEGNCFFSFIRKSLQFCLS